MSELDQSATSQTAGDDAVRPFAVEALDVRGRVVQMGPAVDAILARHDYPDCVSRLLAETVVLTALLGTSLKFDGKFIVQTETDGPVSMLVVDYRTDGGVRGYARFDADRVAAAESARATLPADLLGKGVMAMTVDQGQHMGRYQGVVPLDGDSLEEVAHTYFLQSEQIPTRLRLAVAEVQERGEAGLSRSWRAGGLLVQFLPQAPERARQPDLHGGDAPEGHVPAEPMAEDDAWVEAQALMDTVEDVELTDPAVPVERLLFRLFHERGVRVFEPALLRDECSCSRDKVQGVLAGFTPQEIAESTENGRITVRCEFCDRGYEFQPDEFPDTPSDAA